MSNQVPSFAPPPPLVPNVVATQVRDTRMVFYGQKVIDLGVPVVTFLDDPGWDGHNPMSLPPDVRPDTPQRTFSPYRMKGNIGPQAMRGHISMLTIHHDACLNARSCFKVLVRRGLSTHFIIDNDGTVYQPWDLAHMTWHAGSVNAYSIGFDMSNAAVIQYASHYRDRGVFTGVINGGTFTALGYSEAQYISCIAAIREICRYFPRIKPVPPVGEDGQVVPGVIADPKFEGVVAHFHLSVHKWDPGPGFDWKRIFDGIHGGGYAFPLSLGRGGGGGDILGNKAEETAQRFYKNNEENPGGGWYPIGLNGTWHSGVHLHGEQGQRVNCVYDGEIIAARFVDEVELGSPNFVLMRHKLQVEEKKEITFFSLYMHLNRINLGGTLIPWMIEAKAKAGKPPKDGGGGSLDLDLAADTGGEVDPATLRPEFAKNFFAMRQGKVAIFDPPIEIKGNTLVGYMGSYGPEEERAPQLHFEVFAAEQVIDLKKFHKDWELLDEDTDENSVCDVNEVISKVDPTFTKFGGRASVSSEEITKFYNENPAAAEVRSYIARHVSEWWSGTDWKEALQRRNVWAWDTERKLKILYQRLAPFQWYTPELAKELGLPEDGILYTYHPIRFILWLNMTKGGTNVEVDRKQRGLTAQEFAAAKAKAPDKYEDGNWLQLSNDGSDPSEFLSDWGAEEMDLEEWKRTQGPGEWPPPADVELLLGAKG